jgi:hypothetical protein
LAPAEANSPVEKKEEDYLRPTQKSEDPGNGAWVLAVSLAVRQILPAFQPAECLVNRPPEFWFLQNINKTKA